MQKTKTRILFADSHPTTLQKSHHWSQRPDAPKWTQPKTRRVTTSDRTLGTRFHHQRKSPRLTLSIKRTAMISEMPYENHWTFVSENKSILKRDKITTTTRKSKESAASEKRKLHVAFGNHGTSSNGKQNLSIQSTA